MAEPSPDADLAGAAPLDADATLALLEAWAEQGWLRRLDVALARFVASHSAMPHPAPQPLAPQPPPPQPPLPQPPPPALLLAAALLAQLEGQGHACLPLAQLGQDPAGLLGWGADASLALQGLLGRLPSPQDWPALLQASPAVASALPGLGAEAGQGEPLVLCQDRLYLRRYWAYEQRLAAQLLARGHAVDSVGEAGDVDLARAAHWLGRLFPPTAPAAEAPGFDWQQAACAVALRGGLTVITGGPGTGKTHTAARLLALLLALSPAPDRLRIALAAPTGKAAARLRQAIETALGQLQQQLGDALPLQLLSAQVASARTLHALLGARPGTRHLRHGPAKPLAVDVLIVDEASMVHLEMMAQLLDALPQQARLVLLGDKDQLASVEAGAVLGDLCQGAQAGHYRAATLAYLAATTGQAVPDGLADAQGSALAQQTVMLRRSQRFGGAIGDLARAVNTGDAGLAQALLRASSDGPVAWLAPATPAQVLDLALAGRPGAPGGYQPCLALLAQRPQGSGAEAGQAWVRAVLQAFDRFRVLCALREGDWGVLGLNLAIEARLRQAGLLQGRSEWYEGRPVLVTRNDADLGVFNGDIGLALRSGGAGGEPAGLRVWFADGPALRSVSVSRLPAVETAFAMTVHKAQGSEFDHTVLVLPPEAGRSCSRELIYTGITRARSALTLVSATPDTLVQGLGRSLQRSSGLARLLGG